MEYIINERVHVKKRRTNASRLEAGCDGVCPEGVVCLWKLVVSYDNREEKYLVKEFDGLHLCEKDWQVKALSATYLAKRFVEEFKDNENISMKSFGNTVQK